MQVQVITPFPSLVSGKVIWSSACIHPLHGFGETLHYQWKVPGFINAFYNTCYFFSELIQFTQYCVRFSH